MTSYNLRDITGLEELPPNPSRDNFAYDCVFEGKNVRGREHLTR